VSNDEMSAEWAAKADAWVRNERIYDAAFAPFTEAVLAAADIRPGLRVLDVGCGAGTLLEALTTAGAQPVGVDISPEMTDAARRRAPEATVLQADAQSCDLLAEAPGPPFDRVISRFGVMFFADPVAAFANLRAATAPGGRLAFVCWRAGEKDLFWHGVRAIARRMDTPPAQPADDAPGPMGLARDERIHDVLTGAGWSEPSVEPLDGIADYSLDGGDGVEERLSVALAGRVAQAARRELEPRLGEAGWSALLEDARAELRSRLVDGVVKLTARAWLVTAVNAADRSL